MSQIAVDGPICDDILAIFWQHLLAPQVSVQGTTSKRWIFSHTGLTCTGLKCHMMSYLVTWPVETMCVTWSLCKWENKCSEKERKKSQSLPSLRFFLHYGLEYVRNDLLSLCWCWINILCLYVSCFPFFITRVVWFKLIYFLFKLYF